MKFPLIIGITGGIGSGKTTLSKSLREAGYDVYDSDLEAKGLQTENPKIRKGLIELFGPEIYTPQGLNRPKLAEIVFADQSLLLQLNAIVHPIIRLDFENWVKQHSDRKFVFVESAIMFESGFSKLVNKTILVTASEQLRIERVIKRDGITEEQVKARMSKQYPDDVKIPLADYVIYTDDNLPMADKMKKALDWLLQNLD
jgi:dephospho-CoA kinase